MNCPASSRNSARPPRTPRPPASTASNCMAPMDICSTNSFAMAPIGAPMPTAAASRIAHGFRSRSRRRSSTLWGPQRVGYKLSPGFAGYSMSDSNPVETFSYLAAQLDKLQVGYLHIGEAIAGPMAAPAGTVRVTPILRDRFNGSVIVNGGYDARSGNTAIARGEADLVAFGVPFLANPDLPTRYLRDAPLNAPDQATFYAGEEKGYTDYPALA